MSKKPRVAKRLSNAFRLSTSTVDDGAHASLERPTGSFSKVSGCHNFGLSETRNEDVGHISERKKGKQPVREYGNPYNLDYQQVDQSRYSLDQQRYANQQSHSEQQAKQERPQRVSRFKEHLSWDTIKFSLFEPEPATEVSGPFSKPKHDANAFAETCNRIFDIRSKFQAAMAEIMGTSDTKAKENTDARPMISQPINVPPVHPDSVENARDIVEGRLQLIPIAEAQEARLQNPEAYVNDAKVIRDSADAEMARRVSVFQSYYGEALTPTTSQKSGQSGSGRTPRAPESTRYRDADDHRGRTSSSHDHQPSRRRAISERHELSRDAQGHHSLRHRHNANLENDRGHRYEAISREKSKQRDDIDRVDQWRKTQQREISRHSDVASHRSQSRAAFHSQHSHREDELNRYNQATALRRSAESSGSAIKQSHRDPPRPATSQGLHHEYGSNHGVRPVSSFYSRDESPLQRESHARSRRGSSPRPPPPPPPPKDKFRLVNGKILPAHSSNSPQPYGRIALSEGSDNADKTFVDTYIHENHTSWRVRQYGRNELREEPVMRVPREHNYRRGQGR